jgi:hypothetical protein
MAVDNLRPFVLILIASCRNETPTKNRIELLQGTLDMLVLADPAVGPAARPWHRPGDPGEVGRAAPDRNRFLYPALHRLEGKGWISAAWKTSENNQKAKYYRLTPAGKRQLSQEQSRWKLMVRADRQSDEAGLRIAR